MGVIGKLLHSKSLRTHCELARGGESGEQQSLHPHRRDSTDYGGVGESTEVTHQRDKSGASGRRGGLIVRRSAHAKALALWKLRGGQFLVLVLKLVELPVDASIGQQLLVGTDLADFALVHHHDLV